MAAPWEKYQAQAKPWEKYQASSVPQNEPTTEDKILQAVAPYVAPVGKALDYAGGIVRTAAAAPFSENIGLKDVINAGLANPLSGNEILQRLGVPEGGSLSDVIPGAFTENGAGLSLQKGGPLDVTPRGAGGFALETALDPLTYVSGGLSGLFKGGGEKVYKSAFKEADAAAKLANKIPVSDVLMKEGIAGTSKSVENQARNLSKQLSSTVDNTVKDLADSGARVDMNAVVSGAKNKLLSEIATDSPEKAAEALNLLKTKIPEYLDRGDVDLLQANNLKKRFDFKPKDFSQLANKSDLELSVDKALQSGFKNEIERAASEVNPALGQSIQDANKANSSLLTALGTNTPGPLVKAAKKTQNPFGYFDALLAGGSLTGNPEIIAPALGAAAYKLGKTTTAKTYGGLGLKNLGDILSRTPGSSLIDNPVYRRSLVDLLSNKNK